MADIIHRYNVGVIVEEGTEAAMAAALEALDELWSDPDLSRRCRQAAEEVFSLEAGTEAYRRLYAEILGQDDATKASAGRATTNAR